MFDRRLWQQAQMQIVPLAGAVVFGALVGGAMIAQAWLLSRIIADVFLAGGGLAENHTTLIWLAAVILARVVFVYFREICAGELSIRIRSSLRESLFSRILQTSPVQFSSQRTGVVTATVLQGVERLDAYFRAYLPQLGMAVIVPTMVLVVVFPLDWLTGLVLFLTAPLIPLFMVLIGKEAEKRTTLQWKLLRRLSGHFLDVLQGLRTLKAFGLSKRQSKVIRSVSEEYASITLGVLRIAFLSALTLELLATISTAVVAVQIGLRLMYAQIDLSTSLFILILAPEFYFPLRQLGAAFHSGMDGIAASESIYAMFSNQKEPAHVSSAKQEVPTGAEIRFEDVHYAYQDGDRPSLLGVDISIQPGQHTALVGTSGAGKSTVFSLLMGFIKPDSGSIFVGAVDLDQISLDEWRRQISWVPQFPYLFNTTVLENIRVARPEVFEAEVIAAAQQANADEFIRRLPEGYHTKIGERGMKLSGGQAQRLAIARAFLQNGDLILLDEPASSLDLANEEAIRTALDHLLKGRTVVTISHKISSIVSADQIVVMEQGQVRQVGCHTDLSAVPGPYQELIRIGRNQE